MVEVMLYIFIAAKVVFKLDKLSSVAVLFVNAVASAKKLQEF